MTQGCDTSDCGTANSEHGARAATGRPRRSGRLASTHLLNRNGTWYWWRRIPRRCPWDTDPKSEQPYLRVSLGTTDHRLARSLALRMDASIARIFAMDPIAARQNLPAFCALMRRDAQVRLELARAAVGEAVGWLAGNTTGFFRPVRPRHGSSSRIRAVRVRGNRPIGSDPCRSASSHTSRTLRLSHRRAECQVSWGFRGRRALLHKRPEGGFIS